MRPSNPFAGDTWERIVPGSVRPWIITSAFSGTMAATLTATVPQGMAGIVERIVGLAGFDDVATTAKFNSLDYSLAVVSITVNGAEWTQYRQGAGGNVIPAALVGYGNPVNPSASGVQVFEVATSPVLLRQGDTVAATFSGAFPAIFTSLQLWAIGQLGTPRAEQ